MAENTSIEWTDATWTPIRARRFVGDTEKGWPERIGWHCEHVSPGCKGCYAENMNRWVGTGRDFKPAHLVHHTVHGDKRGDVSMFLDEKLLLEPLRWKRPRMIFVCSMTDLAARFVTDDWIISVLAVAALAPRHTFQVLTKRADRLSALLTQPDMGYQVRGRAWSILGRLPKYAHEGIMQRPWPLPNLWVGTSVEDQRRADERRAPMAALAAQGWLTWVSYEPALSAVDWRGWEFIRWLVSGGESGRDARPSHPDWHRATRDWCAASAVPYTFKQWGMWIPMMGHAEGVPVRGEKFRHPDGTYMGWAGKKAAGRLLDGVTHDGFPRAS